MRWYVIGFFIGFILLMVSLLIYGLLTGGWEVI
jgi:hypothetical protein